MSSHMIGRVIQNYTIKELLGEGGMASVYLALHERLGRTAAIKVIRIGQFPPNYLDNVLRRFEVEARSLAALDHPHIVRVFDYGEFEGMPYLVMEHLTGGTLTASIGSPLRYERAAALLRPIASALEYAHARGVLHRDVKPSNILFSADGRPVLTDFGIARLTEQTDGTGLTSTGVGIGTPDYMAPEQGMGRPVDGRADVYALGIVLYELVTGKRPFGGTTPMEVIMQHFSAPLPLPERIVPELPPLVSTGITRALEKNPETRYASMAEFGAALDALAANNLAELHTQLKRHSPPDEATVIQTPPAAQDDATLQAAFPVRTPARDTGPTLQVPGLPVQIAKPSGRRPPPGRPAQPPYKQPGPSTPSHTAHKNRLPTGWLALGGVFVALLLGLVILQAVQPGAKTSANTVPTLVTFPTETSPAVLPAATIPAFTATVPENLAVQPTNTSEPPTRTPPPTWTPQFIVVTATPALNPALWFPVMPPAAASLEAGSIIEVSNTDVPGVDQTQLNLFASWGRTTSFERYYNHPDACDSSNLFGVYVQIFVFQTAAGADKFYDWAYDGYVVEFVNWVGDRAYLYRNTVTNDQCKEDRVSLTFTRGSLAGRIRMRGVAGKMSDAQILDILKQIAADLDGRLIQYLK